MAKVSIILPSYNHLRFLEKRLSSILNQTYTNWELVIIDDCSTDGSIEYLDNFVQEHQDRVASFIINDVNSKSGYNSWKKGIELAKSEYIWIAETDDYCEDDFLMKLVRCLDEDRGIQLAYVSSNYVDENDSFLYDSLKRTKTLQVKEGQYKVFDSKVIIDALPLNPYLINSSSLVFRRPKTPIDDIIFSFKQKSDQFLWTTLLQGRKVCFLNQKLNYFRQHPHSTTAINFKTKKIEVFNQNVEYCNFFKTGHQHLKVLVRHYVNFNFENKNIMTFFFPKHVFKLKGVPLYRIFLEYLVAVSYQFYKYLNKKIRRK